MKNKERERNEKKLTKHSRRRAGRDIMTSNFLISPFR